ncbi:MAG: hypothetical protein UV73_C0002G0074 [Candidatus Gottesmanbacteria bacterium GW2011_GWA2_43_14]|uniref:Mannosyl-glycoprotein endo-beta-N-acetylglucosamidase-like domain-containing protein n=1 Tax=Candidatus Gottesmanbacteria bacterium GW2011_GWA2_43_14 TaxID=1618443 RepID=A0A0G1DKH6_9BACT|nr:MAG: hypothetical protein UV73_C0002G0074 [Candidatus Gottesmanbacteria bacterium GW2011_GWA2_43_14]
MYLLASVLAVIILLLNPGRVSAVVDSASIVKEIKEAEPVDDRVTRLEKTLTVYGSDLAPYSKFIIAVSDKNNLPWHLLAAISGVESGFCRKIPSVSYNCWGWANGRKYFTDYEDALETVASGIKSNYIDRGLTTPELMNRVYAPPSATWAWKVRYFMNLIEYQTPDISLEFNL